MGNHGQIDEICSFLAFRINYSLGLSQLYMKEIVRLYGVPSTIVSNRDPRFTYMFWGILQKAFGMKLYLSTTYHPQMNGQMERTIQTLEDMLRTYVLDKPGK